MSAGNLFDLPLARSSDPESSYLAAEEAIGSGTVASHEARIIALVVARPGLTGDEIADGLGMTNVQVMRRMRALEVRGLVRRGEPRTSRLSNRLALTWWPEAK